MRHSAAFTVAFMLMVAAVGGCDRQPSVKHIVIDDWWNVDYAKSGCLGQPSVNGCEFIANADIRQYERETATAFAIDGLCHRLTVETFEGPIGKRAMKSTI